MGWVLMSEREVHRVEVLSSVVARRMSTAEAASSLASTRPTHREDSDVLRPTSMVVRKNVQGGLVEALRLAFDKPEC